MYQTIGGTTENFSDVFEFIETVKSARELFAGNSEIYIARAPGRLDVMGGIADYSGSLVLEMPIAEAAYFFRFVGGRGGVRASEIKFMKTPRKKIIR